VHTQCQVKPFLYINVHPSDPLVHPSNTLVHPSDILIHSSDTLVHPGVSLMCSGVFQGTFPLCHHHRQGSHQESPLKSKDLDEPEMFCMILVPCAMAIVEIHQFAHFCIVLQHSKMSPRWPPNQGERLDRLLYNYISASYSYLVQVGNFNPI
jgi:hypothetical protein